MLKGFHHYMSNGFIGIVHQQLPAELETRTRITADQGKRGWEDAKRQLRGFSETPQWYPATGVTGK